MKQTQRYHAACEECRARKLKCSRQRPQCDRCKKDGVLCEYSLQKKMGRPPKPRIRRPTLPIRNQASTTQLDCRYITPEPVSQPRDMYYHAVPEDPLPEWTQLFGDDFGPLQNMDPSEIQHATALDLTTWLTREEGPNNESLNGHTYDFGGIHAPVPVAPIQNHLLTPHSPDLQAQHSHAPRIYISGSPNGSVGFDYPSPSFTATNNMVGQSPALAPAPPVSLASGSPEAAIPIDGSLDDIQPQDACECIFSFLMSITLLKTHLMKSPIPFQSAISTSRAAIATATYSLSCLSCQNNMSRNMSDMECIPDMFLGALLPMLCIFYTKALESIDGMTGAQKVQIEGQDMDIELETWKEMARAAMGKEASRVNTLVDAMGKLSVKKNSVVGGAFCYSADALWEPLCAKLSDMARNRKQCNMERAFAEDIGVC